METALLMLQLGHCILLLLFPLAFCRFLRRPRIAKGEYEWRRRLKVDKWWRGCGRDGDRAT